MAEKVSSAIGPLRIIEEGGVKKVIIGRRGCVKCGKPLLQEKIPVHWAQRFFEECYTYCCEPCCPRGAGKPCNISLEKLTGNHGELRVKSATSTGDLPHRAHTPPGE